MLALQKKYINNVYKPLVKTDEDTKREKTQTINIRIKQRDITADPGTFNDNKVIP